MTFESSKFSGKPVFSQERKDKLTAVYNNDNYITLYRYDIPHKEYNESREGITSKKELLGAWFTSSLEDFKIYIRTRMPGGKLVSCSCRKEYTRFI